MRDDTDEIIRRLEDDVEGVLTALYPGWIEEKRSGKALLTPRIKGKNKRASSSFTMNLTGNRRGSWYRFSQAVGGGIVALFFYERHSAVPSSSHDWADAFNMARDYLGMDQRRKPEPESDAEKQAREERRQQDRINREARHAEQEQERKAAEAERTLTAVEIWNSALPLKGSHAEQYLINRGIAPVSEWPWDPKNVLRFHPSIDHELEKFSGRWPALVGLVVDAFGEPTSLWQVYLDRKEGKKAPLEMVKIGRGPINGGAIRIGGDAAQIGVAEGMESALGSWDLEMFRKPVWSLMSTSGMVNFEPPIFVEHVCIYKDGDKALIKKQTGDVLPPPGDNAAAKLMERLIPMGVGAIASEMPLLGDGLDMKRVFNEYESRYATGAGDAAAKSRSGAPGHR